MDTNRLDIYYNNRTKTEIRVFVASSLKLKDERDAIKETVENVIEKEVPKALGCEDIYHFHAYVYEYDGPQRYELTTAQEAINEEIKTSTFFFLIIDNVIGDKTVEEFKRAREGFKNHQNPAYISILVKQNDEEPNPNEKQISFEKFKEEYLTNFIWCEDNSKMEKDAALYEFPFTSTEQLKDKIFKSIVQWMRSPNRPLVKAQLGKEYTPEEFYGKDEERLRNYDDHIYFKRRFDDELINSLYWENKENQIVYLSGSSLSGKTRAMLRVIHHPQMKYKWFYQVPPFNKIKSEEVQRLADYVNNSTSDQMLYIIFDDFDKYDVDGGTQESRNLKKNIGNLLSAVKDNDFVKVLIVSSLSIRQLTYPELFDESNSTVRSIQIKDLDESQRREAIMYFYRMANTVIPENANFYSIGALLIDLDQKKELYKAFLSEGDKVERCFRHSFLKTIKAFSIWHNSSLGDVDALFKFCRFLVKKARLKDEDGEKVRLDRDDFDQVLHMATNNGRWTLPGLSLSDDGKTLDIQEYVYRYFIDFKGNCNKDYVADSAADEQKLIGTIMDYVDKDDEGLLIVEFAKIICRCQNSKEIPKRMLALFNGHRDKKIDDEDDLEWLERLRKERLKLEMDGIVDEDTEEMANYYPRIFREVLYESETYAAAKEIYLQAKEELRDQWLFSALVIKAQTTEEIEDMKGMPDYCRFISSPLILYKMMLKTSSFEEAEKLMCQIIDNQLQDRKKILRPSPHSLKKVEKLYIQGQRETQLGNFIDGEMLEASMNGRYIILGLNRLFSIITDEEKLERALDLIKENYVYISSHGEQQIMWDQCTLLQPTIIEILGNLKGISVFNAFSELFERDAQQMRDYITGVLIPAIPGTLRHNKDANDKGHVTFPKHKVVTTIATVGNAFIKQFVDGGFKEAYENIFEILVDKEHDLILKDSFTYTNIFRIEDCSLEEAYRIFRDYIVPHTQTQNSPLVLNVFILNELLKKAKKNNVKLLNDIDELFDLYGVERDQYTFNIMLRVIPYQRALVYLNDNICKRRLTCDPYTLGTLTERAPDLRTGLGYLDISKLSLPDGYNVEAIRYNHLAQHIKKNHELIMRQQITWVAIAQKECRYKSDRQALKACLDYLKNSETSNLMLNDGKIFNICLSNNTFITNIKQALRFIKECEDFAYTQGRKFFDSYTLTAILTILKNNNTRKNHQEFIKISNDMFQLAVEHGVELSYREYNLRMALYKAQDEKAYFIFYKKFYEDGCLKNEPYWAMCNPVEYIENMLSCGVELDKSTLKNSIAIKVGMNPQILDRLFELFADVNLDFRTLIEISRIHKIRKNDPRFLHWKEVAKANTPPLEYNKTVINQYINKEITYQEALDLFDTSSKATTTHSINSFLVILREKFKRKEFQTDNIFLKGWEVYERFMKPQEGYELPIAKPNSHTFSLLAVLYASKKDMATLRQEMAQLNNTGKYSLSESEYFFATDIRNAESVAEIKALEDRYNLTHTFISQMIVDTTFLRIVQLANALTQTQITSDQRITGVSANEYAQKIIRYLLSRDVAVATIFSNEDIPSSLKRYGESPKNVSMETIFNILKWKNILEVEDWEKELVRAIFQFYPHTIDRNGTIAKAILRKLKPSPKFFERLPKKDRKQKENILAGKFEMLKSISSELDSIPNSPQLEEFRYALIEEGLKYTEGSSSRAESEFTLVPLCANDKECLTKVLKNVALHQSSYITLEKVIINIINNKLEVDEELATALAWSVINNFSLEPRLKEVLTQIEDGLEENDLRLSHFIVGNPFQWKGCEQKISLDDNVREIIALNRDIRNSQDFNEMVNLLTDFCQERVNRALRKSEDNPYTVASVAARAVVSWLVRMTSEKSYSETKKHKVLLEKVLDVFDPTLRKDTINLLDFLGDNNSTSRLRELEESGHAIFMTKRNIYDVSILHLISDLKDEKKYEIALKINKVPEMLRSLGDSQKIINQIELIPSVNIKEALIIALENSNSSEDFVLILEKISTMEMKYVDIKVADLLIGKAMQFAKDQMQYYEVDYRCLISDQENNLISYDILSSIFRVQSHTQRFLKLSNGVFQEVQKFLKEHGLYLSLSKASNKQKAEKLLENHFKRNGRISHPFVVLTLLKFNDVRRKLVNYIMERGWLNTQILAIGKQERNKYKFKLSRPLFEELLSFTRNKENGGKVVKFFSNSLMISGNSILGDESISKVISSISDEKTYEAFFSTVRRFKLSLNQDHYDELIEKLRYLRWIHYNDNASDLLKEVWSRISTNAYQDTLLQGHFCFSPIAEIKFDSWAKKPIPYKKS